MIQRSNVTWDLSRHGHDLTVHWTQPGEKPSVPSYRREVFKSGDAPWEPWQVAGIVSSVRSGAPIEDVVAGNRPRLSALARVASGVGDGLLNVADFILGRRPMTGGLR